MPSLPVISGIDLIKALERCGFKRVRQKGSHVTMRKRDKKTVVPLHRELARGTINSILKQTGISRVELLKLLK